MKFSFKFLPFKDLFYSVFPTVGTYGGFVQGVAPGLFPNVWASIGIGLIFSILLALLFYRENIKSYNKSLAEILATGYFIHFTGRVGKLLKSKNPIHFSFPDETVKQFSPKQIKVEIGIPTDLDGLKKYSQNIEDQYDIVYVREESRNEPFWVRAAVYNDRLVIYEFPRTLFSLPRYLSEDFKDPDSAAKNSMKIYGHFQEKMDQLLLEYAGEIPKERLSFISV